ncbi:DUF1552 domain-containing protein [Planctomycetes bacterium K23_9]|uniref:DUF1552 domain-containing protein n=1 Tax=Stieleria marina TaxID=1930275 RepID=A0A517NS45_9BACT|nr:hypothetical protein K239x_19100 [Planctomycetes bacterium K23_9]
MTKRTKLDRRTLLRGAGVLLPLPFLNLMKGSALAAPDSKPPKRFMTLFKPNGVHPPSWNINAGTEYDFRLSPLMKPFEKHKDDLLVLDNMGDFGFSSHANSTRRFLSGHHAVKNSASVDQLIAKKISGDTPHRSIELTTEGLFPNQFGCSYISYDENGGAIPRESDPQLVFDRLFRNPLANPKQRKEMASVLDRVQEDARSLGRKAGAEDRRTLDEYMQVVRDSERRLGTMQQVEPNAKFDVDSFKRPGTGANLDEQVDMMLDLIALALWTDSTRCITYMLGNSNSRMVFDFLGIKEQHHYLSHFFRNFSRENLDSLLKISLWHMEKFDSLLTKLKSHAEGDGTLLDNTLVLYGSGMGHSDNHTATRIPIVMAGGKELIKTGRYVRYAENQQLGRLHLSLMHSFGVDIDAFGGSLQPLPGIKGSDFQPYQERPFKSWVRMDDTSVTVQGRLRMSDDLNEAKIFYVDVDGQPAVKVEVVFRDFHDFNLAYHCGTGVTLQGQGSRQGEQVIVTRLKSIQSIFGKSKPGTQNG